MSALKIVPFWESRTNHILVYSAAGGGEELWPLCSCEGPPSGSVHQAAVRTRSLLSSPHDDTPCGPICMHVTALSRALPLPEGRKKAALV